MDMFNKLFKGVAESPRAPDVGRELVVGDYKVTVMDLIAQGWLRKLWKSSAVPIPTPVSPRRLCFRVPGQGSIRQPVRPKEGENNNTTERVKARKKEKRKGRKKKKTKVVSSLFPSSSIFSFYFCPSLDFGTIFLLLFFFFFFFVGWLVGWGVEDADSRCRVDRIGTA
jgi:hypothetical protein